MNNPNTKYDNIPFGQFQGMIKSLQDAEVAARAQDIFLDKLSKKKTRKEVCSVLNLEFDRELGECEIYYRVIDLNVSAQSDESRDGYTIEFVYRNGKQIDIKGRQEQHVLDYLNETDPLQVFTKRA